MVLKDGRLERLLPRSDSCTITTSKWLEDVAFVRKNVPSEGAIDSRTKRVYLSHHYNNTSFTRRTSLRTSETNYLQESYVFYDAIRERRYFNEISEMKK